MNIRWIFKENAEKYDFCVFRKNFFLKSFNEVKIDVSALDSYVLYVNGTLVSRGPVNSFNFKKYYDTKDITSLVKEGENYIAIISHFAYEAGIYARVFDGEKTLCETDETWKTKKYESLDNLTEAKCPPLEPVRLNEEVFDARLDFDILSCNYDFSAWENAVFVHENYSEIVSVKGGSPSYEQIFPTKFMGALAVENPSDFAFRLKNTKREINDVRKCAGEIYLFLVNSKSEMQLDFIAGNTEKCSLNGNEVENHVNLKKGENLFTAYCYTADNDPYFVFKNTENLELIKINNFDAGVLNLYPDDKFYGWAYTDESAYKDSDGEKIIERVLSSRNLADISEFADKILPAKICDTSVSYDITSARYGLLGKCEIDSSLKIKTDFVSEKAKVLNPENMMNSESEFATVDANTALFFDFGSEKLGYLNFELFASAGTVIDIMGFEVVDFGGMRAMPQNCMRYICRDGWQKYISFYTRGMRYLCLTVKNSVSCVKIRGLSLENANVALGRVAEFSCDNETVNEIYAMCTNTARLCMSDTYIDCPGFEQVFWVNDAKITSEINLTNFGEYDFDFRCLKLIAESLSEDYKKSRRKNKAYVEDKFLTVGAVGSYVYGGFPLASFHWGLGIYDYYLYSGDIDGAKELYPYLKKMLSNTEKMMSSRHLFAMEGAWNLLEWAQNDLFPCGEVTANSALLAKLYRNTALLAETLGDSEFSELCLEKSSRIKEAINKYCWNDEIGGYVDTVRDAYGYELYLKFFKENGLKYEDFEAFKSYSRISEQTNVIVEFCDCVSSGRAGRVKALLTDILKDGYTTLHSQPIENILNKERKISDIVRMGTPFLLYYFQGVLARYGEYDGILKIIEKNYKYMIECGTNTCWETFPTPGSDSWTRSVCHGWSASPAIYLLTEICGVKPKAPGFSEFTFKPHTAGLKKINAKIPTPNGFINVKIDTDKNIYDIDYPNSCKLVD